MYIAYYRLSRFQEFAVKVGKSCRMTNYFKKLKAVYGYRIKSNGPLG